MITSVINIKQLAFAMVTHCVVYAVRTEYLERCLGEFKSSKG
jgi:hypothetical protein